jgi:hypothetical protein
MQPGPDTRLASDNTPGDDSEAPTIPELDAAQIAVVIGLDDAALEACARVLGDAVRMIATSDVAAACALLGVLRPALVVVTSALPEHESARLEEKAASFGSRVLRVRADASAAVVAWFVRRAAAVAFSITPPPLLGRRSPPRKEAP